MVKSSLSKWRRREKKREEVRKRKEKEKKGEKDPKFCKTLERGEEIEERNSG